MSYAGNTCLVVSEWQGLQALVFGVTGESGEGGILGSVRLSWSRASLCTPCHRMQDVGCRMQAFFFHMYLLFSIFSCPLIGKSFTRLTISGWITVCRTGLPASFMTESCICYPEFSASNLDGLSVCVCVCTLICIMCMCTHMVMVNGSPVWCIFLQF